MRRRRRQKLREEEQKRRGTVAQNARLLRTVDLRCFYCDRKLGEIPARRMARGLRVKCPCGRVSEF